jgi:hypothetical protein
MRSLHSFALVIPAFAAACSPYSPDLGPSPFLCGDAEPKCPDGYSCEPDPNGGAVMYCLAPNGAIPTDASNGSCANDSQLEPNNTKETAFQTPVATQKNTLTFAGLAICPKGDKDTYAVTITQMGQNLEMLIEFEDGGAAISGSILSNAGNPLMNASPVTGMNRVIRAYIPNMPTGVVFAQAYGPTMGTLQTNNYKLTINVTGP